MKGGLNWFRVVTHLVLAILQVWLMPPEGYYRSTV